MLETVPTLLFAILGGFLPAVLWLLFWLREDRRCPEPRGLLLFAFVTGMLVVPLVIFPQKFVAGFFSGTLLFVVWAALEEIFKFAIAYFLILRRKAVNEPIDAMIYLITVALGFAAVENVLFLFHPFSTGDFIGALLTGNLRFFGATLVHVLSSATIGALLAFAYYKSKVRKEVYGFIGLILAIVLHGLFNFLIIESSGENIFIVFFGVWIGIIILLLLFERVKRIRR